MKIMVASSAGGHWVQMRRILPAFDGFELFFVGVEPGPDPALGAVRYYPIGNFTRKNRRRCSAPAAGSPASSAPSGPSSR